MSIFLVSMYRHVLQFNWHLLRTVCLFAIFLQPMGALLAQDASHDADAVEAQVVSASAAASTEPSIQAADIAAAEPEGSERFEVPTEHHPWARFPVGAWREVQIDTETFDEAGQLTSRNITTQHEVLDAVAEGKYVLKVQATVDLGTKRIVGAWKTRVLDLATDSAGLLAESRRLEDRPLPLTGRASECQVWELFYVDNGRQLKDLIHYDPGRFPYVLQRETSGVRGEVSGPVQVERRTRVTAVDVPCQVQEKILGCTCLRTTRHRSKVDSLTLAFINRAIPGGDVVVRTTDFDAEGRRVRWSVATVLDFGESEPPSQTATNGSPIP